MTWPAPGIILIVTLLFVLVNVAVAADTVAITARQTVVRACALLDPPESLPWQRVRLRDPI